MKKILFLLIVGILAFSCVAKNTEQTNDLLKSTPLYPDCLGGNRGLLKKMPKYDPKVYTAFGVDLRGYNLSQLDLKNNYSELSNATFNAKTIWPKTLPENFNPEKVMETGKNPGLGIRKLHKEGITGKGVSIAIIDQRLLRTHQEYGKQLKLYKEIGYEGEPVKDSASMHGSGVASLAVRRTCGVAPDADLYYIAANNLKMIDDKYQTDYENHIKAIKYILELNKILTENEKIRVISISWGYVDAPDLNEYIQVIKEAKEEGILVITTNLEKEFVYNLMGLGRNEITDPNKLSSYIPGMFWINALYTNTFQVDKNTIFVPMDGKTAASPYGNKEYVFYSDGGLSWTVPWLAGMYALACQVDPAITPEEFLQKAYKTGTPAVFKHSGKEYKDFGNIINPEKLIDAIKVITKSK